jgi:hypothetical protein
MEANEKRVKGISDKICPEKNTNSWFNAKALKKRNTGRAV